MEKFLNPSRIHLATHVEPSRPKALQIVQKMLVVVVQLPCADDVVLVDEIIANFEEIGPFVVELAIEIEEGGALPIHDVAFAMRVVVGGPLLHLGPPRTHLIALEDCPSRGVTHGWVLRIPHKPKVAMQCLVEVFGSLVFLP